MAAYGGGSSSDGGDGCGEAPCGGSATTYGGGGSSGYVYCAVMALEELRRERGTGDVRPVAVHFDRFRDGTLREDPTTALEAGQGWDAVKLLVGGKVSVDGNRYRRLALYRTPLAAWRGDLPLSPCPSADAVAAAAADASTTDLADAPQWVLDGVVLLPTPATALSRWSDSESGDPCQGTAACVLVLADDDVSCAADVVAYYDAAVALGEYDSLSAFAAHAPADCVATVRALLVQVATTGELPDDIMDACDALRAMGEQAGVVHASSC